MIMMMFIFFLSISFLYFKHPMSMNLIILFQTLFISLITGLMNLNFWYSYMLFIIIIGGLMVLFIYMTSIASNEMFNFSWNLLKMYFILMTMLISMMMIYDNFFMNLNFNYLNSLNYSYLNHSLSKFFSFPSVIMIFFLIIYLFITLIAIVKIIDIKSGPLRKNN